MNTHCKISLSIRFAILLVLVFPCNTLFAAEKSKNNIINKTLGGKPAVVISGYDQKTCYVSGQKIIITGAGFGDKKGKGIAIGGNGIHVDVKNILRWSNTQISAILPSDSRIQAKRYYIGIEQDNHSKWLSNINKSFLFCDPPNSTSGGIIVRNKTVNLKPNSAKPKPDPRKTLTLERRDDGDFDNPTGSSGGRDGGYEDDYYEPLNYQPEKERSYGSLINKGLPEAPKVLIKESKNKSSEHRESQEAMVASADMESAIELAAYLSQYNITIKRRKLYSNLGIVISILRIPEGESVPDTINSIRQEIPDLWADENQRYTLLASSGKRYGQEQIGWTSKHKSCVQNVKLGLIDTGVANHPALASQQIINKSFLAAGVQSAPFDHGTAIAGILVGKETSDEFHGLLPNAELYSAAIFRLRDKKKVDTTAELVITALDWLVGEGVEVINLSFGGPRNLILELVLNSLVENGHTIVSAAGSSGKNGPPLYPAAQPGVSAPGVDVWVASPNGTGKYSSGSSFAAPFVTALAVLISENSQSIYDDLKKSVSDLGSPGKDSEYGWGLVGASSACE